MQSAVGSRMPALPVVHLAHLVETRGWFVVVGAVVGALVMLVIRRRGWSWTCGLPLVVAAPFAWLFDWRAGVGYHMCAFAAVGGGAWRHLVDLRAGGDLAQRARDRVGPMVPIRRWWSWRKLRTGQWVTSQGVAIGFSRQGELVRVPIAGSRTVMSLLLGATGSGKTVVQVLLALAALERGLGVIYIDPKGDDFVLEELRAAAARAGRPFRPWDPQGKTIYNPYERGTNTEIADKRAPAIGSRSLPSQTSVICWTPQPAECKSICANRSTAATSSCSGSRQIGDRWRHRCSGRRSSKTSSRSATSASTESSDQAS
jgi:hypothetical protein